MGAMNTGPRHVTLFTQATSGISAPVDLSAYEIVKAFVTCYGTVSAGSLVFEENDHGPDAPSTWSITNTIDLTALTGGSTTGITQAIAVPSSAPGPYAWGWLRARFATGVSGTGGSATVTIRAR